MKNLSVRQLGILLCALLEFADSRQAGFASVSTAQSLISDIEAELEILKSESAI